LFSDVISMTRHFTPQASRHMNVSDWLTQQIIAPRIRVVAITGAADLGKSYLASNLAAELDRMGQSAVCLGLDAYLISRNERAARGISGYAPESHDLRSAKADIERLLAGQPIEYFEYQHEEGRRSEQSSTLPPADKIIIEGLHAMHSSLATFVDFSIFLFTSDELLRRIRKEADMIKRRLSPEEAERQATSEMDNYHQYVHLYKAACDVCLYVDEQHQYHLA